MTPRTKHVNLPFIFYYLIFLSISDHPNLVIYPAIVGSMASETVKVFKTDQEQEEDTLPEEVKFAVSYLKFELFT